MTDEGSRALLRERATCVWLEAPPEVLAVRLRADSTPRPPLLGDDAATELGELLARRGPHYRELAAFSIDADRAPSAVVEDIVRELEGLAEH